MSESDRKNEGTVDKTETVKDEWLIRPCRIYEDEYKDCRSIKARFHQYFVFGKVSDCTQWRRDCDNCYKWKDNKNIKAAGEIIESEKVRRKARLGAHYANDVWAKRKTPPTNWNAPLPKGMQEQYEHSFLYLKSRELKGEIVSTPDSSNFCVVM